MLKIFLMSRNNLRELKCTIKSISNRTRIDYQIIVVDNASTDSELISWLKWQEKKGELIVVFNTFNLWVLGLNVALKMHLKADDVFFLVSDSDIVVPNFSTGDCWLKRLKDEINKFPCIGKLGLSLDLGYIKTRPNFSDAYMRESMYFENERIGDNYIAPVDTTMAIYRANYFITNRPMFIPGHGIMGRPHYYCCRTSQPLLAKHIGWRSYSAPQFKNAHEEKILCFTLLGAYLDPEFLKHSPRRYALFYKAIRPIARVIWGSCVYILFVLWFVKNSPFRLNTIQYYAK